ncbi:MAG: ABC transporter ATP-binding protein [Burkholderiaceae bacterium]|nr:ABC transporter ATP-binding protein [Burkholderiaceae bacterium]
MLGPNGVGKTTLMRTLAGSLPVQRGSLQFDQRDVTVVASHQRARAGIGYVPQGRGIFPQLTVRENMLVGLYATRQPLALLDETLREFPALQRKLGDAGGSLSGGQQQQLALARALVIQPRLLLLDEPSEGIQPSVLDEISDILLRFKRARNLSVLLVEQNLDFAASLADRAYMMDVGRISRQLESGELSDDTALQREFLGAA